MKFATALTAILALTAAGCAQIIIDDEHHDNTINYFEPRPYLAVTERLDQNGNAIGRETAIVYLPDCNRPRSMRSRGGFGSVVFNPTLTNGWNLTGLASTVDAQIDESLGAIVSALPVFGIAGVGAPAGSQLQTGLYAMNFDATSGTLASFTIVSPATDTTANKVTVCGG